MLLASRACCGPAASTPSTSLCHVVVRAAAAAAAVEAAAAAPAIVSFAEGALLDLQEPWDVVARLRVVRVLEGVRVSDSLRREAGDPVREARREAVRRGEGPRDLGDHLDGDDVEVETSQIRARSRGRVRPGGAEDGDDGNHGGKQGSARAAAGRAAHAAAVDTAVHGGAGRGAA